MKSKNVVGSWSMIVLCGLSTFGCAEKPMSTIDSATQALQEARQAGANDYAPQTFRQAENAFQKAQEELAIQESKFALLRDYDEVQGLLVTVNMEAAKAKSEALTNKELFRQEAQTAMNMAKGRIEEARVILTQAPMGKGSQADLQALKGDLKTAESMIPDLETAMVKEDFLGAKAKAQAIESLATRVHDEVAHALQKTGKAKA